MKQKELTTEKRMEIVTWHKAGKSVREISTIVGWPKSTIQDTIQRWQQTGLLQSKARVGRPPKVTATMKKRIDRYLGRKDEAVSKEIVRDLHLPVSARAVRYVRRELGYTASKGQAAIQLSALDKVARVKWCKKHQGDNFSNMIFTDEKPFELYKRRRLSYTKHGRERKKKVTVKYPPKIQCWGGVSRKGKTQLVFWMGRPKSKDYCDTLERALLPSIRAYYPGRHRFFHDHDSTHKSKEINEWLKEHGVNTYLCPVRSPDLNPIEMIWNTLEYKVMAHNPKTEDELKTWTIKEWDKLDLEVVNSTIDKMISRILKIIQAEGSFVD